jgi:hypothetical protein
MRTPIERKADQAIARSGRPPIDIAAELYYSKGIDFAAALNRYMRTGYVASRPSCFAMAKPITLEDGRAAWFMEMAVGSLREICSLMPTPLPWLCFKRGLRGPGGRLHIIPMERVLKTAFK